MFEIFPRAETPSANYHRNKKDGKRRQPTKTPARTEKEPLAASESEDSAQAAVVAEVAEGFEQAMITDEVTQHLHKGSEMVAPIFAPVSPVGIVKDGFILNKGRRKTLFKIPSDPHHLEENFSWPLSSNIHLKKKPFSLAC